MELQGGIQSQITNWKLPKKVKYCNVTTIATMTTILTFKKKNHFTSLNNKNKYTELSGRIICPCDPWQPRWETGTVILRGSPLHLSKHVLTPDKWYSHQAGATLGKIFLTINFNWLISRGKRSPFFLKRKKEFLKIIIFYS